MGNKTAIIGRRKTADKIKTLYQQATGAAIRPPQPPKTAVNVSIDDILHVGKWKRIRPKLEGIIGRPVPMDAHGRNEWIVIYRASDGRIGTMATIEGIKTVNDLKGYLLNYGGLTVE